ncbi:MAG: type II secretion system protein GspN [bacterium]
MRGTIHTKRILLLSAYTVIAFLIFTVLLFPSEMITRKTEWALSRHFPGTIRIKDVSFILPARVRIRGLEMIVPADEKPFSIVIDRAEAGIDFLSLVKGKIGIKGKLTKGEGRIQVSVNHRLWGAPARHLSAALTNLAIQDFPVLSQQFGIHVTGILQGDLDVDWVGKDIINSNGTWSFTIDEGRMIPRQFPAFSYTSITGEGSITDQHVVIDRVEVQGDDLSLNATGRVRLAYQLQQIFVDTQVGLKVFPGLRQRLGGFATLLPTPDTHGFINLFISGPPGDLRFSSRRHR